MTISIIIPYYNHGAYLHAAVQSCLVDRVDVEVIIVNDGSKEAHAEAYLAKAAALSSSVSVIYKPNGGLSSARNAGLEVVSGDFVQFLDSDDVLVPGKLRLQKQQLTSFPDVVASVSSYVLSDEDMNELSRPVDSISPYPLDLQSVLYRWERGFSIPIHCGLFRRSGLADIRFDETVHGKEDWIFWSSLFSRFDGQVAYLPFLGAVYRQHAGGMTKSINHMAESWHRAAEIITPGVSGRFPEFADESRRWHEHFYRGARSETKREVGGRSQNQQIYLKTRPAAIGDQSMVDCDRIRVASISSQPLVSFIVPVYNHSKYLDKCIDSLKFSDRDAEYEIIVVDDCSPDEGVSNVLRNRAEDPRLSIFRSVKNVGISRTQNAAAQMAKGSYLAFVDCDDFLAPNAWAVMSSALRGNPSVDYVFTDRTDVDEGGQPIRVARYGGYDWIRPSGDIARDLVFGMIASHLKVIRRSRYLEAGGCDPLLSGIQDWDLALRLARKASFAYVPETVYNHRIHSESVTRSARLAQFSQSNILRRSFIDEKFPRTSNAKEVFVSWFDGHKMLFDIVDVIADDHCAVFRQQCKLPLTQLQMLREFNGFFDRLEVEADVAAQLMGFLGDQEVRIIQGSFSSTRFG